MWKNDVTSFYRILIRLVWRKWVENTPSGWAENAPVRISSLKRNSTWIETYRSYLHALEIWLATIQAYSKCKMATGALLNHRAKPFTCVNRAILMRIYCFKLRVNFYQVCSVTYKDFGLSIIISVGHKCTTGQQSSILSYLV